MERRLVALNAGREKVEESERVENTNMIQKKGMTRSTVEVHKAS